MWKRLYIAQALLEGQCGMLTMINTQILASLFEKKIFENVETSLYSMGFVSSTVWNTDHLPILAIFIETFLDFGHFCKFYVETSVYRDVSTFFNYRNGV